MAGFLKSALNVFGIGGKGADNSYLKDMTLEQFLSEIAALTGHEITFTKGDREGSTYHFEISGTDTEAFLGSSSEVLEALSHLSLRFVRRKEGTSEQSADGAPGEQIRITFDSGEFRSKKVEELRELAAGKRQKVLDQGGKPAYINALGPSDRKVIHTYVSEVGDIVSESIGTGYFKRIRIRLKDDNRPRAEGGQQARGEGGGGNRGGRGGRNNNNRGGRGGQGRGPSNGGGGQNRGRFGGGQNRGPRDNNPNREATPGNDVNGNVFRPESTYDDVDDNIGNRLKPGEEPLFGFNDNNESDRG